MLLNSSRLERNITDNNITQQEGVKGKCLLKTHKGIDHDGLSANEKLK